MDWAIESSYHLKYTFILEICTYYQGFCIKEGCGGVSAAVVVDVITASQMTWMNQQLE
jgi:hypothetical protein